MSSYLEYSYSKMIIKKPMFAPELWQYLTTNLDEMDVASLLFEFCTCHLTGSYSIFDTMSNLTDDFGYDADISASIVDVVINLGTSLFYSLMTNATSYILLYSDVINVTPHDSDSWLVTYDASNVSDMLSYMGLKLNASGFIQANNYAINFPYTVDSPYVRDILDTAKCLS